MGTKISALNALTGENVATDDVIVINDTSATETKKITFAELLEAINKMYADSALSGDGEWSGIATTVTFGESVVFGDLVMYDTTDNEYKKADADASATMPCSGIALETKGDGDTGLMLTHGFIYHTDWSFTEGAIVYVSGTAGDPTTTAPSGSGDIVQAIGQAIGITAFLMFFNPSFTLVEIA